MKKSVKSKFSFRTLIMVWIITITAYFCVYFISMLFDNIISQNTFWALNGFVGLLSVMVTSFFSFTIFKNNDDNNARSEEFRSLQFVATNHTIIEFVDNMLIFLEHKNYIEKLKATKDFKFYMRENEINLQDVIANFDDFMFLTVKIPFKTTVGNPPSFLQVQNIKITDTKKEYNFVPCAKSFSALVLYNDADKRQEASVNLIIKKDNDFFDPNFVNQFLKIKFHLIMHSLLGVAVEGWTELYFTNPERIEKNGASKYKINSTQFKISARPTLANVIDI